ncbi:MAG: hypothetical protein A2033_03355 [Bacteroidetes bacterium GWA2_31_9]|nr:MAG: hypothetical protein A2033_03355 [Bacteroidetes bacterium GWA2_31_9]
MNEINLIDETIDINLTLTYHLSIKLLQDGFSFSILDTVRNKYIAISHYIVDLKIETFSDKFEKIIDSNELLQRNFKSVYVMCCFSKFTQVPAPLFDASKVDSIFNFLHEKDDDEELLHNKLDISGTYLIFAIKKNYLDLISKQFPNAKFFHYSLPIIENKLMLYKNKQQQKVFVNINKSSFDILVIDCNKMLLFNTYMIENEDDFIYFILYVFEQLALNPEDVEVIFMGNTKKDDLYFQKARKYIRNLKFDKYDDYYTYSYVFYELPAYVYSNFLNLHKCVS